MKVKCIKCGEAGYLMKKKTLTLGRSYTYWYVKHQKRKKIKWCYIGKKLPREYEELIEGTQKVHKDCTQTREEEKSGESFKLKEIMREAVLEVLRFLNGSSALIAGKLAGPEGFEPSITGSAGRGKGRKAWVKEIGQVKALLEEFRDFLFIDKQLAERTVERYMLEVRKHLRSLSQDLKSISKRDIREYLKRFRNAPAGTYANVLKSLKLFYRDFLGRGDLVEGFKFPSKARRVLKIPSKADLRKAFELLKDERARAMFMLYATTGLRRNELLELRLKDIDFERRMILPGKSSRTKRTWVTFFNKEAEKVLKSYMKGMNLEDDERIFPVSTEYLRKRLKEIERKTGIKISPQILREWFSAEMGRLGIPDRYVDAFCGRVPKSVLAKHYTDYSPETLKEIYNRAGLKVLN